MIYSFVRPFPISISFRNRAALSRYNIRRWQACQKSTKENIQLNEEELQAANAAIRVSRILATGSNQDENLLSTIELLSYCSVKGLSINTNMWDRKNILLTAKQYINEERLVRLSKGDEWDKLSTQTKIHLSHKVCNAEGDVTYIDPPSGYTVFTFYAHLRRGSCCGIKWPSGEGVGDYERTHRCRHCPYTDDGRISSKKMEALKQRIPILEYVREKAQEDWDLSISYSNMLSTADSKDENAIVSEVKDNRMGQATMQDGKFAHLKKVTQVEKPDGDGPWNCEPCHDQRVVTCTRCNGWTILFSPQLGKCPQCEAKGYHPCMNCTPYRPPARRSFYD